METFVEIMFYSTHWSLEVVLQQRRARLSMWVTS